MQSCEQTNELMTQEMLEFYQNEGYAILRGVFSEAEVAEMQEALDKWHFYGELHGRTWRKQNTIIWVDPDMARDGGACVRGMQWPAYHDLVLGKYRTDERLFKIVEPITGPDVKQIINQIHWKPPGSKISWPLHRDVRSRKPDAAFNNLFGSWVQTGIALDPHTEKNGAMKVVPRSHLDTNNDPADSSTFIVPEYAEDERIIDIEMQPGDVAIWNAFTVHGGGVNSTENLFRRLYINGYMRAEDCTRGEWAWKGGESCELDADEQALIQFEEVAEKKEAHYV